MPNMVRSDHIWHNVTPSLAPAPSVIRTEDGLLFIKEGPAWRCAEIPELVMLRGSAYAVPPIAGEFNDARAALLALLEWVEKTQPLDVPEVASKASRLSTAQLIAALRRRLGR